jgi:hypothetical protein
MTSLPTLPMWHAQNYGVFPEAGVLCLILLQASQWRHFAPDLLVRITERCTWRVCIRALKSL